MSAFINEHALKTIYCAHGGAGSGNSPDDPLPLADGALMEVEDGDVITGVDVIVTTAITGVTVLDVGDGVDPNGYMAASTLTAGAFPGAGVYVEAAGTPFSRAARVYTAADTIDLDITTASTAGACAIVVKGYRV